MEAWELALALSGSFVAGYVGSMLGLVLGTLRLPLIVAVSGSPLAAAGTNIAISAASAGAGALRHAREGRVDWRVVAWMAPPSIVGAVLGAVFAGDVSERLLYAAIAAVLLWSGIDLVLRPVRALARERLRLLPAVLSGFGIGVLGGAVGVILGTLRMPALVRGVGLGVKRAAGTNLVVGFLLGVAGFAAHAGALGVDWATLAAGLAGALPGGWLGAKATGRYDERAAATRPRRSPRGRRRRLRGAGGALALGAGDRRDRLRQLPRGRLARERQHGAGPDGERPRCGLARDRDQAHATGTPSAGRRRSRDRRRRRRRRRRRCCVQGMRSTRRSDPGSPSRRRVPRCRAARSEARPSPAAHRRARSRSPRASACTCASLGPTSVSLTVRRIVSVPERATQVRL